MTPMEAAQRAHQLQAMAAEHAVRIADAVVVGQCPDADVVARYVQWRTEAAQLAGAGQVP